MENEDVRLQQIQDRCVAYLDEINKHKTQWNRNIGWIPPGANFARDDFNEHALDDMVWLMQQYVTTHALLVSKMAYIEDLKNRFIYPEMGLDTDV